MSERENDRDARVLGDGEEEVVRDLLRSAFGSDEAPETDVLRGVQRKIRQRSRGKFYTDRWATAKHPPINTYLVTSVLMFCLLVAAYLVLRPLSGASTAVHNEPEPVNIVPPVRH